MHYTIATNCKFDILPRGDYKIVDFEIQNNKNADLIILSFGRVLCNKNISIIKKHYDILKNYSYEIPCYVIGLSSTIQHTNFSEYKSPYRDKIIKDFIDLVLSRSRAIGVSDSLTARWLTEFFGYDKKCVIELIDETDVNNNTKFTNFINYIDLKLDLEMSNLFSSIKAKKQYPLKNDNFENKIILYSPYISCHNDKARLECTVEIDGTQNILWIEVDNNYKEYLEYKASDAFIFSILPYAMRTGHDIVSLSPTTHDFFHNITEILIPTLCNCDNRFHKTKIICDTVPTPKKENANVACGLSCGVDSFYSLLYYLHSPHKEYRPTHIYTGNYLYTKAIEIIRSRSKDVADALHLPFVTTNTNLTEFFPTIPHLYTHFYKTLFPILALKRLFPTYIYSAGYDYSHTNFSYPGTLDTALYEILLINTLNTRDFTLINGGCSVTREQKITYLMKHKITYKNMNVCLYPERQTNCSQCEKCLRTLLVLDLYDALDLYKGSFDIFLYTSHRKEAISYLEKHKDTIFLKDIYNKLKKKKPELFKNS